MLPYLLYLPGVTTVGMLHSLMLDAPEALVSPPEIKPLHYKTIVQTPPLSSTNRLTLSQQLTFKPKGNLQSPVNLTTLTACPSTPCRPDNKSTQTNVLPRVMKV